MPDDQYYGLSIDVGALLSLRKGLKARGLTDDGADVATMVVVEWAADHDLLDFVCRGNEVSGPGIDEIIPPEVFTRAMREAGGAGWTDPAAAPAVMPAPGPAPGPAEPLNEEHASTAPAVSGAVVDAAEGKADPAVSVAGAEVAAAAPAAWSDTDIQRLAAMREAGRPISAIAADLGRSAGAVHQKLRWMARRKDAASPAPVTPPAPAPAVARTPAPAATAEPAPASMPVPPGSDAGKCPVWWQEIEANLNALGNKAPWTRHADLMLVEGLMAGRTLIEVADDIGVDAGAAKARFEVLTPTDQRDRHGRRLVSLDQQQQLLRVLRSCVAEFLPQ